MRKGQSPKRVTLYIASAQGWWKQSFADIDSAHEVLMAVKRTRTGSHWAMSPSELDDGGLTPPFSATIRQFVD